MSNLKNIQRKISEGISGWLLFEFNCERGYLFNEKYLAYPLGQILNSISEYKTRTEINHPNGNGGRGRPLQIDFVLTDDNNNWKFALESKWIGNTTISLGTIICDLIRLQNLFYHQNELTCYFILAGFEKKLKLLLSTFNITHIPNSQNSNTTIKSNPTFMTIDLFKLDGTTKAHINKFVIKYPNMILYSKIRCRPSHKFPKKDIVNMSFSTYIFELMPPDRTHKIKNL